MIRSAEARWAGDLKTGKGNVKSGSGAINGPYHFDTRFESAPGTNPEELLGAAHAACFSMALGFALEKAGHVAESVDTTAKVHLDKNDAGFAISKIELDTKVKATGLADADLQRLAEETKKGCIVSRALSAVPMELKATLA
jgi:osmotically inducible protein OsmC